MASVASKLLAVAAMVLAVLLVGMVGAIFWPSLFPAQSNQPSAKLLPAAPGAPASGAALTKKTDSAARTASRRRAAREAPLAVVPQQAGSSDRISSPAPGSKVGRTFSMSPVVLPPLPQKRASVEMAYRGTILAAPSQTVAGLPGSDPALVNWLRRWEAAMARGEAVSSQPYDELTTLLARSNLPPADLYQIGQTMAFIAADPIEKEPYSSATAAEPWYRRMLEQASESSGGIERGSPEALTLLAAVKRCESTFWLLHDGKSVEIETNLFLRLLPPDDRRITEARISHADAMYLEGKNDQAMKEVGAIAADSAIISPTDRANLEWAKALTMVLIVFGEDTQ